MAILCYSCNEDVESLFSRCRECNYAICRDCVLKLYSVSSYNIKRYDNTCVACYTYFDESILYYLAENPNDKPLFINVELEYSPWNNILNEYIKNLISPEELLSNAGLMTNQ